MINCFPCCPSARIRTGRDTENILLEGERKPKLCKSIQCGISDFTGTLRLLGAGAEALRSGPCRGQRMTSLRQCTRVLFSSDCVIPLSIFYSTGAGKVSPNGMHVCSQAQNKSKVSPTPGPGEGALSQLGRDYSPLLVGGDALDVLRGAVGRGAGPPHARTGRYPGGCPAGRRGRHLHAEIRKDSDHRRGLESQARVLWAQTGGGSGSGSGGGGSSGVSGGGSSGARHQPAIPLVSRGHCARRRGALMCSQRAEVEGGRGGGAGGVRGTCKQQNVSGWGLFSLLGGTVAPPSFQDVALTGCSSSAARAQLREEGEGVEEEGCTRRLGEDLAGARE